jgi:hypothetical protein
MWEAGGLQAPQGPAVLRSGQSCKPQPFRSVHACRRHAHAQSAQLGERDRASRSTASCSAESNNGCSPPEQNGQGPRQLYDDCHHSGQESSSGGRNYNNGANGAFSLDELPASLNGSNGSGPVPQSPRLVGAYDSDSEENSTLTELDQRILGGEFTDAGSTKAKLTKPARRVLSKGFGPGEPVVRTRTHE